MSAFIKAGAIFALVVFSAIYGLGLEFVLALCLVLALRRVWISSLKPEILMYLAGLPNHLKFSIFIGFPFGVAARTLAFALILVPIYVLAP